MVEITINGTSWSCRESWVSFEDFVKQSAWAYPDYSEQDRLALLKMAYNYKYPEVTDGKSDGSTGDASVS